MIKLLNVGMTINVLLFIAFLFGLIFLGQWQFKKGASNWPHILKRIGFLFILGFFTVGVSMMNGATVLAADNAAERGKNTFAKMACSSCHSINGEGAQVGPDLSYVGDKRDRKWLLAHFKDPKGVSPNSIMPPVSLPDAELGDLTAYMLSLKKGAK
jgi:mono/diheme cytochrome c family protein